MFSNNDTGDAITFLIGAILLIGIPVALAFVLL